MRRKKFITLFKIGFIFLFTIFVFHIFKDYVSNSRNIKLSFLDVGQGDACLIKTPNNKIVLIDGGPDNIVLRRLENRIPFYKRRIHLIIISHFHSDHIVGLVEIFRRYRVDYLAIGKNLKKFYPAELIFLEAKKQNTKIIYIDNEIKFSFQSDCFINIINPSYISKNNDNDSLISKLSCNHLSFLSSGDNEVEIEDNLLQSSYDISSQIFKASHHGSKTSNSNEFLGAVDPRLMIISVGADNRFGHPSQEVLNITDKLNIEVKRTDELGTIDILGEVY